MSGEIRFEYPQVFRNESCVDEIHGHHVKDPYRYLEDPDSDQTKNFVTKNNEVTKNYLNKCPCRSEISEILTADQDFKKIGCPFKRGEKYYLFMNSGLQPQSVLYQQDSVDGEPKVFFDPNKLSDDGTIALSQTSFSPNGEYMAYALSHNGSDWLEIKIMKVMTGECMCDKLTRAKLTSIEWTHDNKGFFYAQYPEYEGSSGGTDTEKNENHTLYYHRLNTSQTDDVLKVSYPDHPNWYIVFEVSTCGKYLYVYPREGCTDHQWFYCRLQDFGPKDSFSLKPLYEKTDCEFKYIANDNEIVYFKTNMGANNYRIMKLDLRNPTVDYWVDVIPNHPQDVIQWAELYTVDKQDILLIDYLRNVNHYLELYNLNGHLLKRFETSLGIILKELGRRDDDEFFFQFTSFLTPGQTYHFDLTNLDSEPRKFKESMPKNFIPDDYTIEQVFYPSKDKVRVPMFIVHRKDLIRDGQNPCLLYGYGGFHIQVTPSFDANRIVWLRNFKGILVVANIRGGGEFGQKWHDSGRLLNKQNCFDDFVAAGQYLIDHKYTNQEKLAIQGGSNGGLLVAAASNQRPDLFAASVCHVALLDMIRFPLFTVGHAFRSEYGDPAKKEDFEYLIKYSPYHNIPEFAERYPATLLLAADHDDLVVPAHSLKFIAQLQHKLGNQLPETPLLIRVDTKAGHGAGRPLSKIIDEYADIYSFLHNALGLQDHYFPEI